MEEFTVGDLRRHLKVFSDDTVLEIAGGLTFYRLKLVDDKVVFLEFNEAEAELSPKDRKNIQVAFMRIPDMDAS